MRCNVCDGEVLSPAEYVTPTLRAPALECASCGALVLDEGVARTGKERDSVRRAKAARARLAYDDPQELS